jgi:hypothetical protein
MSLLPTTRFAIVLKDGRRVLLAWDMAAIFAREEDERSGERITLLLTLFHMTRTSAEAPTIEELRESFQAISAPQAASLLKAIGATRLLGETGGLPQPETETRKEESALFDWRKAISRAIGYLRISMPEFWRMTPFEFSLRLDAAVENLKDERGFTAQMTANLMNVSMRGLKQPISGEDLFGGPKLGDNGMPFLSQMGIEDRQAALDRIWEKVQRQRAKGETPGGTA